MISNFKLFPNFNISQNFYQNVQKQKNTAVLSCGLNNFNLCFRGVEELVLVMIMKANVALAEVPSSALTSCIATHLTMANAVRTTYWQTRALSLDGNVVNAV